MKHQHSVSELQQLHNLLVTIHNIKTWETISLKDYVEQRLGNRFKQEYFADFRVDQKVKLYEDTLIHDSMPIG